MIRSLLVIASSIFLTVNESRAELSEHTLSVKEHRFEPSRLEVPAGQKLKLIIKNHDLTPEEFESYDFNREKVIEGQGEVSLFVGPLEAGEYKFFGDFHPDTAQGTLIVK